MYSLHIAIWNSYYGEGPQSIHNSPRKKEKKKRNYNREQKVECANPLFPCLCPFPKHVAEPDTTTAKGNITMILGAII